MTKTTNRQRAVNLYTVEQDGHPVAQAEAISQAEAVRLYVESQQQPTLSARLATPMDARKLAHLPLLSRGAAAAPQRDPRVPDMFDDAPAAPVSPVVGAPVMTRHELLTELARAELMATYDPPVETCRPADHVEEVLAMVPPQHAPIAAVVEGLAPGGLAAGDCAPCADQPTDAPPASADATVWLDDVALTARKSDAFHAGLELGKRGLKRFSAEMLAADAEVLRDIRMRSDSEAVHDELLRGFNEGKAAAGLPSDLSERRRLFPDPPKGAGKVEAKYRNPETGESWSGRGLKPKWLVMAGEAGKTLEDFAV